MGSGFCVHPRGIVVTCEHVLSGFMRKPLAQAIDDSGTANEKIPIDTAVPFAVFFFSGHGHELVAFPVRASMGMAKTDHDIGMIRLQSHKAFEKNGFPFLEIAPYAELHEGNEIGTCGFPLGTYLYEQIGTITSSFTKGIISSVIPAHGAPVEYLRGFQLDLVATHGNSGGPVFRYDSGKVFGALERGVVGQDGKLIHGLCVAAPVYPVFEHDTVNRMLNAPISQIPVP